MRLSHIPCPMNQWGGFKLRWGSVSIFFFFFEKDHSGKTGGSKTSEIILQ